MKQGEKNITLTVVNVVNKTIDIVLLVFFLLLFLIGAYTMYDTLLIYNAASDSNLKSFRPNIVDGETEWDMSVLSDDVVAWITIDGTSIDYPILQGMNNSEYLNKDPFGKYSISGSIFMDYRNAPDFSDPYSLIYGHHMEYGHMFGALDDFMNEGYFNEHRTGTLIIGNNIYSIKFFACLEADATNKAIFIPDSAEDALQYVQSNAHIWNEPNEGRLIALSTCKSDTTARTILFGVICNE